LPPNPDLAIEETQDSVPVMPVAARDPVRRDGDSSAPLGDGLTRIGSRETEEGNGISFFQVPARGTAVVYVIDRSASMGLHGTLETAKRELLASLGHLPSTARFQVIFYNRQAEPLRIGGRSDLLPASRENKDAAAALLLSLRAEGGTEHARALQRALALQPDTIFFRSEERRVGKECGS